MMSLVQQERNTDDTMSKINESDLELKLLFKRIDCLEKLIADINSNLNFLENQIEDAENSAGLSNNSTKIRNLLHPLLVSYNILQQLLKWFTNKTFFFLQKMGSDHEKVEQHGQSADVFQTQHYFTKSSD